MKSHRPGSRWLAAGLTLITLGACTSAEQPRTCGGPRLEPGTTPDWHGARIEISGAGLTTPASFTADELRAMEWTRLDAYMQRSHAPSLNTSWRGPALANLFEAAGVPVGDMRVTLVASDGYAATCPRSRLTSAIIALEDGDGNSLAESEGYRWRLVVPEATGNYWIVNLERIILEPTPD